jgi:tetratricopeptide (TPR) repeat protein
MYSCPMALGYLLSFLLLFPASSRAIPHPVKSFDDVTRRAGAARDANRVSDAINLYREGVRLRPQWSEGWWSLGTLLYDQDRFAEAEEAFKRFAGQTPKPGVAYAFLGLCEYETQEYDHALAHFRAWARAGWPGTPQLLDVGVFHFALLLTRNGEFVQSLYLIAPAAAKVGENPALAEAMGLASLRMQNLPEDYPPERREMVWLAGEAALYWAQQPHDFARADEYAARLESRYPQQLEVHYFRGTLFNFEGKPAEAEREYREELRISPQHVPAMLALVDIDLDQNELTEAAVLAKKAVALEPKNPEAHHALGRVLMTEGQLQASAKELETAKQLNPDSALVRSHLAMVYSRLGRTRAAKAEAAAFLVLKKKEGILASPEGKQKSSVKGEAR